MKQPKRPHMPLGVKLAACLIRLGYNPRDVVWDHSPPLAMREINAKGTDWMPSANDPNHIAPLSKAEHKLKTHGSHVPLSGDVSKIAKMKRIIRKQSIDTSDIPEAGKESFARVTFKRLPKEGDTLTVGGVTIALDGARKRAWPKRKIPARVKTGEST